MGKNTFLFGILLASYMLNVFAHNCVPPRPAPMYSPMKPPTKPPSYSPVDPPTKPPTMPPVKPPTTPPTYPPVKAPTMPPTYSTIAPTPDPASQPVVLQGYVVCKSCKQSGNYTLDGVIPLSGATVQLVCTNTKQFLRIKATSNGNGYYLFKQSTISIFTVSLCKVLLIKSSNKSCNIPTNVDKNNIVDGTTWSLLRPEKYAPGNAPLYSASLFAFEPAKSVKCKK